MHGQAPAVYVVRLFAQEVEKLSVDHADKEVERAVRIAHDEEQRRFAVMIAVETDFVKAIWTAVGYTVLLCFCLFKTSSLSRSILGAH